MRRVRRARDRTSTNYTRPLVRNLNRRLTKRKIRQYKRNLWIATTAMQKWRLGFTAASGIGTPADTTSYNSVPFPCYKTPVDITDPTNWSSDDGTRTVTTTGDVVILRGGIYTLTLAHENAENIDYRIYLVMLKDISLAQGTVDKSVMPIFADEAKSEVRLLKYWEGTLAPSTSMKLSHKLGITKMDKFFQTANKMQPCFVVCAGNTVTASTVTLSVVASIDCWMCADVIS